MKDWVIPQQHRFEEGLYELECIEVRGPHRMGGRYKLELVFAVVCGPYSDELAYEVSVNSSETAPPGPSGQTVSCYYNLQRTGEQFSYGRRGKLRRHAELALGGSLDEVGDLTPEEIFLGKRFLARVGTVKREYRGQALRGRDQYSVVRELLRLVDEVPRNDEC